MFTVSVCIWTKLFVYLESDSHTQDLFVKLSVHLPLLSVLSSPTPSSLFWLHPRIFSHPNVLPMLGACQSPPAPHPIIITHWMPYGSLYNVLHEGTSEYFHYSHKFLTCQQLGWFAGICDLLHLNVCRYVAISFFFHPSISTTDLLMWLKTGRPKSFFFVCLSRRQPLWSTRLKRSSSP